MTDFAYITLTASEDAHCRISLNGFPLLDEPRAARMQWMDIMNLFMMRDNILQLEIATEAGQSVTGELRLARHSQESIVAPDTGARLAAEMRAEAGTPVAQHNDGTFTLSGTGRVRAELRFASFGPDFTHRLLPERAITPEQAIPVAQAVLLALEKGNLDAILSLMDPVLQDMAQVWQQPLTQIREVNREGLGFLAEGLPGEGLEYSLSALQIGPLVQVMRNGGPLLQSMDGQTSREAIFGWADDGIMMIR